MMGEVVVLDHLCVGHRFGGQDGRQPFGQPIVFAANPVPFLTLVLEAIDVKSDRCSGDAQN